jgi:rfaE bifunctional protein nucleotidyltransferase chain/domain
MKAFSKLVFIQDKILNLSTLPQKLALWRFKQEKIVFTNGCFDLLHRGHIEYLIQASELGDQLIVGINSDTSVKTLQKGVSRPLQDEYSRALAIAAMHYVDAVIIFNEQTPLELIKMILPDVLVKGGDWSKESIVGSDIVLEKGGSVQTIPFLEGYSTTTIEQKILHGKD